jgi:hypothetical protein
MTARLRWLDAPDPDRVPADPVEFLRNLAGPVALRQPGADGSRARVVVALAHGNEPSGLRAVHAWLRGRRRPAVDTLLLVPSVEAALREPLFSHRFLPGRRDLNRCFLGPFEGPDGELAGEMLQAIETAKPEALIDLHNNSGHNPAYGVGARAGTVERALAGLFGERFVVTRHAIGALIEAVHSAPVMTIECGRAGDPGADAVAEQGLARFLEAPRLEPGLLSPRPLQVLVDPVRVRFIEGVDLAVAEGPVPAAHFTLRREIDRHNFEELPAGTAIGWLAEGCPWPIQALAENGEDRSRELFSRRGGRLETRRPIIPVMMTTDPEAARSDCLFYAVRRAAPA